MEQRFSGIRFVVYLVCFTSLIWLRLLISPNGDDGMLAWIGCVAFLATGYMIWFAGSEGRLRNLTGGALSYLAIAAVVAACPPFVLLLVFWSISGLFNKRRALMMHALASVALFILVFPMPLARFIGMPELAGAPAGAAYFIFALMYSALASRRPLKTGMFRFATMLVAVPLIGSFVALVGGGMLSRPERRTRSTMRARRAAAAALALPAPVVRHEENAVGVAALAFVAGVTAEVLMPAAVAE